MHSGVVEFLVFEPDARGSLPTGADCLWPFLGRVLLRADSGMLFN